MIARLIFVLGLAIYTSAQIPDIPPRLILPGRVVSLTSGLIQGTEEHYGFFKRILAYKGIPYAQPPVGNLRFQAPQPAKSWTGILEAQNHGPNCPQMSEYGTGAEFFGEEDCLHLNVFTPTRIVGRLPVVVSIHGGENNTSFVLCEFIRNILCF